MQRITAVVSFLLHLPSSCRLLSPRRPWICWRKRLFTVASWMPLNIARSSTPSSAEFLQVVRETRSIRFFFFFFLLFCFSVSNLQLFLSLLRGSQLTFLKQLSPVLQSLPKPSLSLSLFALPRLSKPTCARGPLLEISRALFFELHSLRAACVLSLDFLLSCFPPTWLDASADQQILPNGCKSERYPHRKRPPQRLASSVLAHAWKKWHR